jgi:methylthioribose-1-phosphate isomerase
MKIQGKDYRTIWMKKDDPNVIQIIDQRWLPHQFVIEDLAKLEDFEAAIREMHVRGAPLIGSTAAFGMYIAARQALTSGLFEFSMKKAAEKLKATRPTAVNLAYAVDRVLEAMKEGETENEKVQFILKAAEEITEESVVQCKSIGDYGLDLIKSLSKKKKGKTVNILTHCNAGWIACIDYGTATAPIYAAHDAGIDVHVWVDETRPRNQGARITAFELKEHGVPHTVIPDNTGGHLMQHGMVDMVIVGTDRTTLNGDVANKIGTYLKALAANDNDVPFYVALPSSSIDWEIEDGLKEIPIEQRDPEEVKYIQGLDGDEVRKVLLTPKESPAVNYGFDVTPARLVTALITERGLCAASKESILSLFPEKNLRFF